MIAEQEIEERLKDKISALYYGADFNPRMVGMWDVVDAGEVKGQGDASKSVIALTVGLRQYASFCTPQADLPCVAVLSVRRDAAPTGAALAQLIEPIMNLVHVWNKDCDKMCDDLTTNTFNPAGFQLNGGDIIQDDICWTVTINFILRGIVNVAEG